MIYSRKITLICISSGENLSWSYWTEDRQDCFKVRMLEKCFTWISKPPTIHFINIFSSIVIIHTSAKGIHFSLSRKSSGAERSQNGKLLEMHLWVYVGLQKLDGYT